MKSQLTSLDIYHVMDEIHSSVRDSILRKVYQVGDILILQLYKPKEGTIELALSTRFVALLNYRIPKPKEPGNFAMLLRKHLKGKRVVEFYQRGFDRVVVMEFEEYMLICELLPRANIMFVDKKDARLWSAMIKQNLRFRGLRIHHPYAYPEPPLNPKEISTSQLLKELKKAGNQKIVSFLAQRLSLSGKYAEEACLRKGIDKNLVCEHVREEEAEKLINVIGGMLNHQAREPQIIFDENGSMLDVTPIRLQIYANFNTKKFESFNEAINDYFVSILKEEMIEKKKKQKSKYSMSERLEHRLRQQMHALELYKKREECLRKAGNKIYEHYHEISQLLEKIQAMPLEDAVHMKNVVRFDKKKKEVVIKIDDAEITLYLDKSLNECAAMHYEEAKKVRKKIERLMKEIEITKKEISEARDRENEMEKRMDAEVIVKKERKKKRWYEKFRWFFTSNNTLVVCGKDATTNEILIKKYMESEDLVLHADYPGSPFALMKKARNKAELSEIKEAAQFVASYSRAWKEGAASLNVFYVYPEQVSKKAPAGEYIKKGAFMIYGEKNWLKVEMKLAAVIRDNKLVVVPALSVKPNEKHVLISPGHMKMKELAGRIISALKRVANKEEREVLESLSEDELIPLLPPGGGMVVKR